MADESFGIALRLCRQTTVTTSRGRSTSSVRHTSKFKPPPKQANSPLLGDRCSTKYCYCPATAMPTAHLMDNRIQHVEVTLRSIRTSCNASNDGIVSSDFTQSKSKQIRFQFSRCIRYVTFPSLR